MKCSLPKATASAADYTPEKPFGFHDHVLPRFSKSRLTTIGEVYRRNLRSVLEVSRFVPALADENHVQEHGEQKEAHMKNSRNSAQHLSRLILEAIVASPFCLFFFQVVLPQAAFYAPVREVTQ